tara:strand:- start:476 stop:751 length:276 start_codon:yes stop_codon:yes gene_type:complete
MENNLNNYQMNEESMDPAEFSSKPPVPSNERGSAKPVFSDSSKKYANYMYGDIDQRQNTLPNTPMFMKDQTGDGKITQADVIKARIEGYKE